MLADGDIIGSAVLCVVRSGVWGWARGAPGQKLVPAVESKLEELIDKHTHSSAATGTDPESRQVLLVFKSSLLSHTPVKFIRIKSFKKDDCHFLSHLLLFSPESQEILTFFLWIRNSDFLAILFIFQLNSEFVSQFCVYLTNLTFFLAIICLSCKSDFLNSEFVSCNSIFIAIAFLSCSSDFSLNLELVLFLTMFLDFFSEFLSRNSVWIYYSLYLVVLTFFSEFRVCLTILIYFSCNSAFKSLFWI